MCCPVSADSGLCDRIQRKVVMYDGRMITVNGSTSAWQDTEESGDVRWKDDDSERLNKCVAGVVSHRH